MPRPILSSTALPAPYGPGWDEANVARLGLISILERIPENYTSWTAEYVQAGHVATVTCEAVSKHGGVPHGLDNDVAAALIDVYLEQGSPADGLIRLTMRTLLKRIGWEPKGHYYKAARSALLRLSTTTYWATNSWYHQDTQTLTSVNFRYLDKVESALVQSQSTSHTSRFEPSTILHIKLGEHIVDSIRARYLKPLNLAFLQSLERLTARALYRLLDAQRPQLAEPGVLSESFSISVLAWGQACKIVDQEPKKIRRTLESAHSELLERGYLSAVEYEGRGRSQMVHYRFNPDFDAQPRLALPGAPLRARRMASLHSGQDSEDTPQGPAGAAVVLERLVGQGISRAVAETLLEEHGTERALERLDQGLKLLEGGYRVRSRPAFLVDVLRHPEKYAVAATRPLFQVAPLPLEHAGEPAADPEREDLTSSVERALALSQFMLKKNLSVAEFARLALTLEQGELHPQEWVARLTEANRAGTLHELVDELLARWA